MGQLMQGLHLGRRRHELRFVHQDAGDPGRAGGFGTEVGRVVKGRRLTLGPRRDVTKPSPKRSSTRAV